MKRAFVCALMFAALSAVDQTNALAAGWGRTATSASFVTMEWLWIDANTTTTITTTNLSPGDSDTVLFLTDPFGNQVAKNDDYNGTLASSLTYTSHAGSWHLVIVMAWSPVRAGTCDIVVNRSTWRSGVSFAGQPVSLSVAPGQGSDIRTVGHPGGVSDTVLFGLDANGNMKTVNDDDWYAPDQYMSRLDPQVPIATVVLGTYSVGSSGPVYLVVNDPGDSDGDGIGPLAEAAMCTCDKATDTTCGLGCTSSYGVRDTRDSDGDGLRDDWETYGVAQDPADPYGFPQLLPRWGSNPARKDVFVELDWQADYAPVQATVLDWISQVYGAIGTATQMRNRDGTPGVSLHFDIGIASSNPSNTLWGDWGGAGEYGPTSSYKTPSAQEWVLSRRKIFHHGVASDKSGGQAATTPGLLFRANGGDSVTLAHELGHDLDLRHGGRPSAADFNGKPNYRSLMNYAFNTKASSGGFSGGTAPLLNPKALCEESGLLTTICAEIAHIGPGTTHSYLTVQGATYCGVDWNRDGTIQSCSELVEAAPNYSAGGGQPELGRYYLHGRDTPAFNGDTPSYAPDMEATPSIARVQAEGESRLYVAHRSASTGKVILSYTTEEFGVGCPSVYSGCAGWQSVELDHIASSGTGPALVTTKAGRLMVVYRNASGVHWAVLATDHSDQVSGTLPNSADAHREPVAAVGPYGHPRVLYRTGIGATGSLYMATYDESTLSFSAPQAQTLASGQPFLVLGVYGASPGLVSEAEVEFRVVVSEIKSTAPYYYWYKLNLATGRWEDKRQIAPQLNVLTSKRVGFAYRTNKGSGAGAYGGRYYIIYQYAADPDHPGSYLHGIRMTRGDTGAGDRLDWIPASYFDNAERHTKAGAHLLGWERVVRYETNLRFAGTFDTYVDFKPFADGIIGIELKDSRDREVMERGICAALHGCGSQSNPQLPSCKTAAESTACVGHQSPTIHW